MWHWETRPATAYLRLGTHIVPENNLAWLEGREDKSTVVHLCTGEEFVVKISTDEIFEVLRVKAK